MMRPLYITSLVSDPPVVTMYIISGGSQSAPTCLSVLVVESLETHLTVPVLELPVLQQALSARVDESAATEAERPMRWNGGAEMPV